MSLETAQKISDWPGENNIKGNASALVFDFGIEVGGILSVTYTATGEGAMGMAFTEGLNWIGLYSDSSNGKFQAGDGALYQNFTSAGTYTYTMPDKSLRGGFKYLTLFLLTTDPEASITFDDISLEIAFEPTWANLRNYQGYFHSSDELLNRIWYAGAYTLQTNNAPPNTGRWVPTLSKGWANNGTMGPGETIIMDGAKRDRAVWPGDMGVAVPSLFYSVGGEMDSVRNALQVMFDYQNKDGSLPESGPPLLQQSSTTYNMWTMIGCYNYILYTNDTAWLTNIWPKYNLLMGYINRQVTYPSGLMNVTGLRDWARWQTGFNNSQAQMIYYHTLRTSAQLATWLDDPSLASNWSARADAIAPAINTYCWSDTAGAFKDNATSTTLIPQDANSLAILFGIVPPPGSSPLPSPSNSSFPLSSRASSISSALTKNWTPIGAETPELPGNISPFISSFEIQAHLTIGETDRALDLIRRSWGWYANNPNGTGSTVIEGYLTNGSFSYRSSRGYGYDASYPSHAHGWSSGPTSALTEYVLGLRVVGRQGSEWSLKPQFGDLSSVRGGWTTGLGKFEAGWERDEEGGVEVWWKTPKGTKGTVAVGEVGGGMRAVVEGRQRGEGERKWEVVGGEGRVRVKKVDEAMLCCAR
ncbi:hypothetical protein KVT40_008676 [Elsinoe batatas]|uniref:Alpha-L-rhamnosidase six-hairpin glycosidase domain-containing protein n=1 Tax=Elsinoe batatas TaxID=2601811 RepID=A0A8K0P9Q7_9PEZI|nr:hypothetical protein KVT40_008676 [Elsinoe batatas]